MIKKQLYYFVLRVFDTIREMIDKRKFSFIAPIHSSINLKYRSASSILILVYLDRLLSSISLMNTLIKNTSYYSKLTVN